MKKLKYGLITLFMVGLLPAVSTADNKEDKQEKFKTLDINSDGFVTHEEMMKMVQKKFSEYDKDGNGSIALSELPKEMPMPEHMQERREKHREKMQRLRAEGEGHEDADQKGHAKAKHTRIMFMARMDKDKDELISLEEFSMGKIRHFKKMDHNGDGKVSLAELDAAEKHMMKKHMKRRHKNSAPK